MKRNKIAQRCNDLVGGIEEKTSPVGSTGFHLNSLACRIVVRYSFKSRAGVTLTNACHAQVGLFCFT